jgi:hypothetical protein
VQRGGGEEEAEEEEDEVEVRRSCEGRRKLVRCRWSLARWRLEKRARRAGLGLTPGQACYRTRGVKLLGFAGRLSQMRGQNSQRPESAAAVQLLYNNRGTHRPLP